jgi:hypothetical protein
VPISERTPVFRFMVVTLVVLLPVLSAGCRYTRTAVEYRGHTELDVAQRDVKHPSKVHLHDGSVVLFPAGFTLQGDRLEGSGTRWDLTRTSASLVSPVPLESVAGIEYYRDETAVGHTTLAAVAVVAAIPLAAGLLKAIFGSCPTVYSAEGEVLEAELFSRSIARLFETDDLDRLSHVDDSDGEVLLQVANEALETHYIDRLGLLGVVHPAGFEVFPGPAGEVVPFGSTATLISAVSRAGEDLAETLSSRDEIAYRSDKRLVEELTQMLSEDWIELEVAVPPGAETMSLAWRSRNTLLTTVLFYDVILGSQGVGAIDWQGSQLEDPAYASQFASWFRNHFGIRVEMDDGVAYREVGYIPATGPIAWHEAAVDLPVPPTPTARLRLSFLPDNWMIDWIAVSFETTTDYSVERLRLLSAESLTGGGTSDAVALLSDVDGDRLVTYPGERYALRFAGVAVPPGRDRTYLVASHGYYVEWLRPEWLAVPHAAPLTFDDALIRTTAQQWLAHRAELEREFFVRRVPTRPGGAR